MIKKEEQRKKRSLIMDILILLLFFSIAFYWSTVINETYAPDEGMRYTIPKYIYEHNALPKPDDPEVVHWAFHASYAYYPLLLGSIVSSFFMKIASLCKTGEMGLLIAARLVSVLSGTTFVYFWMKIAKKLFNQRAYYFAVLLGAFLPQFVYLSCYINNDSIALAASSMMVYAWILAMEKGWNLKNSVLLAIGIIMCALSYYNAYAWILMSMVMFMVGFLDKNQKVTEKKNVKLALDWKNMLKYGIIVSSIVLLGISYFFIRNYIVNDGDLLGMKSFLNACEEGGIDEVKPSNRNTAKNLGISWIEMLFSKEWTGTSWIKSTATSFICVLGAIQYPIANGYYMFYYILFGVGLIAMIFAFIFKTKKNVQMKIFYSCLFVVAMITIALGIQYSYATDYQAQRTIFISNVFVTSYFYSNGNSDDFRICRKMDKK